MASRRVSLLALTALALTSPVAVAHSAEEPTEVEVHVLQDEGEDSFYFYDGYDLYNLFVREAYWEPLDQEGLIFRFTLYGGFTPAAYSGELHIDIGGDGADGTRVLRVSTADDATWAGDLQVVAINVTEDEPPFNGVTARIQAFASYDSLGLAPGGSFSNVYMASYAGEDLVDVAPGGFFVPGSMGNLEVPAESERLVETIELSGPVGYVGVNAAAEGSRVTFQLENVFASTGQHFTLVPGSAPGWSAGFDGPSAVSLDGGESGSVVLNASVEPTATEPLPVAIVSDVGGREWWYLGVDGETLMASPEATVTVAPMEATDDSPWPGAMALVAVLGAALLIRRRR